MIAPRGHALTLEELLLELGLGDLDFDGAVNLLLVTALVVGIVFNGGGEQGVDEGSLSQSRLSGNLDAILLVSRIPAGHSKLRHTIIVNAAPRFATILCLEKFPLEMFHRQFQRCRRKYTPLVGELHEKPQLAFSDSDLADEGLHWQCQ